MFHCQHLVSQLRPFIKHLFQSEHTCFKTEITPAAHLGLFLHLYLRKTFSPGLQVGLQPRWLKAKIQSFIFRLGWKMIRKWSSTNFYSKWLKAGSLSSSVKGNLFFADLSCVNTLFLGFFPLHYSVLISSNISFSPVPGCSSRSLF